MTKIEKQEKDDAWAAVEHVMTCQRALISAGKMLADKMNYVDDSGVREAFVLRRVLPPREHDAPPKQLEALWREWFNEKWPIVAKRIRAIREIQRAKYEREQLLESLQLTEDQKRLLGIQ